MARLLSAGDVLVEYDQAYEHYGVPQPEILAQDLQPTPTGLSDPVSFGAPVPNVATISTLDEQDLAATPNPRMAVTAGHLHRHRPPAHHQGRVEPRCPGGGRRRHRAPEPGERRDTRHHKRHLLRRNPRHQARPAQELMKDGAALVVTDTNRKQAFRWDTLTANNGETETPTDDPAADHTQRQPHRPLPRRAAPTRDSVAELRRCR